MINVPPFKLGEPVDKIKFHRNDNPGVLFDADEDTVVRTNFPPLKYSMDDYKK